MNLHRFLIGQLSDHWRKALWMLIGAILCYPLAHCQGKRDAKLIHAAKVEAASAKVERAAAQAELAATVADATRRAKTKEETDELRTIIQEAPDGGNAGPATSALLAKLRERDRRAAGSRSR